MSGSDAGATCLGPYAVSHETRWYVHWGPGQFDHWALQAWADAGFVETGSSFMSGTDMTPASGLMFAPNPDPDNLVVRVTWVGAGHGRTAAAYVVQATWTPPVPVAATLPTAITSVTVRLVGGNRTSPIVRTFRNGLPMGLLASAYRELPMDTRAPLVSCAVNMGGESTVVRYRWPGGVLVLREGNDTCGGAEASTAKGRLLAMLRDPQLSVMALAKRLLARS